MDLVPVRRGAGTVLAVGAGKLLDDGRRADFQVSVGDRIILAGYAGKDVKVNGVEYLLISESDLLAILGWGCRRWPRRKSLSTPRRARPFSAASGNKMRGKFIASILRVQTAPGARLLPILARVVHPFSFLVGPVALEPPRYPP